jgi:hypothetical protein
MLDGNIRAPVHKEFGVALVDVKPHLSTKKLFDLRQCMCGSVHYQQNSIIFSITGIMVEGEGSLITGATHVL